MNIKAIIYATNLIEMSIFAHTWRPPFAFFCDITYNKRMQCNTLLSSIRINVFARAIACHVKLRAFHRALGLYAYAKGGRKVMHPDCTVHPKCTAGAGGMPKIKA